jgi:Flp pilus assembly protein TadG
MSNLKEVGLKPGISPDRKSDTSMAALMRRFGEDKRGSVAIMFGLMVVPCVMSVGLAVDVGRSISVKNQSQHVADAAALAAGRKYQSSRDMADATSVAQSHVAASLAGQQHTVTAPTTELTPNLAKGELTATVTQWVRTPFTSASELLFSAAADSDAPPACARSFWDCHKVVSKSTVKVAQGLLQTGDTLEISVMLDITGSMLSRPSGQTSGDNKMVSMQKAAKSFVDIVLPVEDTQGTTRVAIVPFAGGVRIDETLIAAVAAPVADSCTRNQPGCADYKFTKYNDKNINSTDPDKKPKEYTAKVSAHCLADRKGANQYTDEMPSSTNAATRFPRFYPRIPNEGGGYTGNCKLYDPAKPSRNMVLPLGSDPVVMKDHITDLTTVNDTAGQLGTAWAWYMLSPQWAPLFPAANRPGNYDPKVKKIAVLMTDGAYNTQYCNGLDTDAEQSLSEASKSTRCTTTSSQAHAEELCKQMKGPDKDKIIIYTIGFDVDSASSEFLKTKCATSAAHHYDVTSGAAIQAAFTDIALKATKLVITQ